MTGIVGIIQARTGSTRLPGKVLLPLGSRSVLGVIVERLRRASRLDAIAVATTIDASDDAILSECDAYGIPVYRGSTRDVLGRYVAAAKWLEAANVVRITADCPFVDPEIVDLMLTQFDREKFDLLSNVVHRTFPRGLDVEIATRDALERAAMAATSDADREHAMPYLYRAENGFRVGSFIDPNGRDRSAWRWTLDTSDDYRFFTEVVERLKPQAPETFTTEQIAGLIERDPTLLQLNAHERQKTS